MEKKITKRQALSIIGAMMNEDAVRDLFPFTVDEDVTVTPEDIVEFVDKSIEQLDKKAAGAAKRAAEKRAEGDELRAEIEAVLTGEYQSTQEIMKKLDVEDLTPAKVTARLTQLVKADIAAKTDIKVDGRKIKGYALVAALEDAEETEAMEEAEDAVEE